MTDAQRIANETRIRHAMMSLVGNPEFASFMDVLRQQREIAIEDACSDSVVASERASMAAIGEIRVYKTIISTYEEFVARVSDEANRGIG